jgi:PTH2 family peptidyl-tRNA hydrolase
MSIKQVIVMRKDLNMRRGKEIAQGAHAAMAFLSIKAQDQAPLTDVEKEWLNGTFTKVCVRVNSEAELDQVAAAARQDGLQVSVITDSGKTEFAGVPTKTCLAIGPDLAEKVDRITGALALY